MTKIKEVLRNLDFGNSVAEFDNDLEKYFVETETFRSLINDDKDIVAGDKGTGKTAIFRVLQKRHREMPELNRIDLLPAFNPQGSPIFAKLGDDGARSEADYIKLWKAYFLSLIGHWLLQKFEGRNTELLTRLDHLLRTIGLRDEVNNPETLFNKVRSRLGALFTPTNSELEFGISGDGTPVFKPRLEWKGEVKPTVIPVESTFRLLTLILEQEGLKVWILLDRLDEAFQAHPDVEVPALRALFRVYLDLKEFDRIGIKLFVRRDLFRRLTATNFVNLTHVNARKIEVIWDDDDLLNLLSRRVKENAQFCEALEITSQTTNIAIFDRIFPDQVDPGQRRPKTWKWILARIRDANGIKPPRNLIDLVSLSQQAQLRIEDREERVLAAGEPVIEGEALRNGLKRLSETRVTDTLLAESGHLSQIIERFRGGKAEQNDASLADVLELKNGELKKVIRGLIEVGFLEEIKESYKVPLLYRDGLEITQGKAFDETGAVDDEE